MFGLLYVGLTTLFREIGNAQYKYETYQNRKKARNNGKETYLDCYGAERLVDNGKYVFRHTKGYDIHGDYVMEDENGNIIHNYSKYQRDKDNKINIELAELNKNTVYQKGQSLNEKNDIHHLRTIYIDFETGREMFVQSIGMHDFYRDAKTGDYIRRADMDCRRVHKDKGTYDYQEIINEANDKWNKYSTHNKQRILESEMRKIAGSSDLSVPSSSRFSLNVFNKSMFIITQEDYDKIMKKYS